MRRLTLLSLFILLVTALPARAENIEALLDRVDRMERDMQNLQMEVFQGGKSAASGAASGSNLGAGAVNRLDSRISELEMNLRQLTGRIEELTHKQSEAQRLNEKQTSDNDVRMQMIEQQLRTLTAQAAAAPQPAQQQPQNTLLPGEEPLPDAALDTPIAPPANPEPPQDPGKSASGDYDAAIALLQQGNYPAAESAFKEWLKLYPKHNLAGNAQYWLAETYYVRGDYAASAVEFLKAYQNYNKSNKSPDSLLKLGLSLSNLGNKGEACATLAKLSKEFPKANKNIISRAAAETKKLQCKA